MLWIVGTNLDRINDESWGGTGGTTDEHGLTQMGIGFAEDGVCLSGAPWG